MRVITSATSESVVRNPSMHKEVTSYLEVFLIKSHFAATAVHVWLTNTSANYRGIWVSSSVVVLRNHVAIFTSAKSGSTTVPQEQ